MFARDLAFHRQLAKQPQHAVFTVQRHHELRMHQVQQMLQFLAAGVAADVHSRIDHLVDHACAASKQIVN